MRARISHRNCVVAIKTMTQKLKKMGKEEIIELGTSLLPLAVDYAREWKLEPEVVSYLEALRDGQTEEAEQMRNELGLQRTLPLSNRPVTIPGGGVARWSEPKPHDHGWISVPLGSSGKKPADPESFKKSAQENLVTSAQEFAREKKWSADIEAPQLAKGLEIMARAVYFGTELPREEVQKEWEQAYLARVSLEERAKINEKKESLDTGFEGIMLFLWEVEEKLESLVSKGGEE